MYCLYVLFGIGWMNEVRDGKLSIYKVDFLDCVPEIMLSVTIQDNFSWIVTYRRQHVNKEFCSILRNMPFELNSGMLSISYTYSIISISFSFKSNRSFNDSFWC